MSRALSPAKRWRARSNADPITLSEQDGVRFLHFGSPWVQGAMLLDAPEVIVIDYVARMMGWQLFLEAPRRILQLGLGAGALTRFTRARVPEAQVTVVERSAEVIATARHWFALPREGRLLRVVHADAGKFLESVASATGEGAGAGRGGRYAVVQVDLYDMHARGPVLDSVAFYRDCRAVLAPAGIVVVNLFGRHSSFAPNLGRIGRAFDGRVLAMPPTDAGNVVAFAFSGPPIAISWRALRARARELRDRLGLDAPGWVAALREGRQGKTLVV